MAAKVGLKLNMAALKPGGKPNIKKKPNFNRKQTMGTTAVLNKPTANADRRKRTTRRKRVILEDATVDVDEF